MRCNRLASENHTLKRNMGVYIAEAQRAKRILQHSMQSRAEQQDHMTHDQQCVGSGHQQPAQLSRQHAQQESGEHAHTTQSPASWVPSQYSPALQQTHNSESPPHCSQAEFSRMTHQHSGSAGQGCSPCDKFKLQNQHEAAQDDEAATSSQVAQLDDSFTQDAGMGLSENSRHAAGGAQPLAAAEASFALASFNEGFYKQPADAQRSPSQPGNAIVGNTRQQSSVQTDKLLHELPHSDVRQTVHRWYESHQEDNETTKWHSDRAQTGRGDTNRAESGRGESSRAESGRAESGRGEAGRGETADGVGDNQATAACDFTYRKQASPVAAKFSFARWAGIELNRPRLSTALDSAKVAHSIRTGQYLALHENRPRLSTALEQAKVEH